MDKSKIYLEDLIRKELLETITPEELALLEAEKQLYSEDIYEYIVVEVLRDLEDELPVGKLTDWQPDIPALIKEVEAMKAAEEFQKEDNKNDKNNLDREH